LDFKQRIIQELNLTQIQANTILKDYIEVCEKLAKEYHELQLKKETCQGFTFDDKNTSATVCKCGLEKWRHKLK
jgi:hypothetical protein